jgi:mono/diheme cytochrome c family protein
MKKYILPCGILIVILGAAAGGVTQTTGAPMPPLVIQSLTGRDLFDFYCATCHGRDGKGSGPVAAALKVPPPDLTRLARSNVGAFPRERVEMFVMHGRDALAPAHGTAEMPVWGPVFLGLDRSDTRVKIRIANVVDYVGSLQVK